jgi:transposase-like protein
MCESLVMTKRSYKKWSADRKLELVREAQQTSFYGTAKRHGVHSNQLFSWRKKIMNTAVPAEVLETV